MLCSAITDKLCHCPNAAPNETIFMSQTLLKTAKQAIGLQAATFLLYRYSYSDIIIVSYMRQSRFVPFLWLVRQPGTGFPQIRDNFQNNGACSQFHQLLKTVLFRLAW